MYQPTPMVTTPMIAIVTTSAVCGSTLISAIVTTSHAISSTPPPVSSNRVRLLG